MLEAFFKDLRHPIRMFRQSPVFTIAAIAALTLGIGANTAIFSVVNAVMLKPVSLPDPDGVVFFMNTSPQGSGPAASPAKFMHYRQQGAVVQDVSAFNSGIVNYTSGSFPEQLRSGRASSDFFKLFGAPIVMGRSLSAEEDAPNGPRATLISHSLWTSRFNSDPNVVGKTISPAGSPTKLSACSASSTSGSSVRHRRYGWRFNSTPTRMTRGIIFRRPGASCRACCSNRPKPSSRRRPPTIESSSHAGSVRMPSTPVVIINEAMAKQYWPNADPLSDRLVIGRGIMPAFADEPDRQVIGVVADTRTQGLDSEPTPAMYIPQAQVPDGANALNVRLSPMAWVVRTQTSPLGMSNAIQEQIRQATGLPVSNVRPMSEVVSLSFSRQQFNMWLMTVFGGCALLLAAIGVYGLMAYSVEQRTQEIGIRLALGAQASQVKNMVVFQGMRLALVGVVIGVAAACGLARLISTFLFGVTARDPFVFVGVPALLTAVAVLAVWIPARRASRVDPLTALRYE